MHCVMAHADGFSDGHAAPAGAQAGSTRTPGLPAPLVEPDPDKLFAALTTEHFALQGARGSTTSEGSARAALFLGATSSSLISLGFVSEDVALFRTFALIVLPTLVFLGAVTFVRVVENGVEDFLYARGINRIRRYYLDLAGPERAPLFILAAHDDAAGVLHNMGLRPGSRVQLLFTFASAIAVINSVIAAAAVGVAAGALGAPTGLAVGAGVVAVLVAFALHLRFQARAQQHFGGMDEVLFPSAASGDDPAPARAFD